MSVAAVRVVGVLRVRTPGRNNSNASVDAMAAHNVRSAAARSRNALLSSSVRRSNNSKPRRRRRESAPDVVAVAVAVGVVGGEKQLFRIRMPRRRSQGLRANRDRHARRKRPVHRAKKAHSLAPRETLRNGGDAFGAVVGVGAVVVRRAVLHPRRLISPLPR